MCHFGSICVHIMSSQPRFHCKAVAPGQTEPPREFLSSKLKKRVDKKYLGGGQTFLVFSPRKLGKTSNLTSIFFRSVVQPPTRYDVGFV